MAHIVVVFDDVVSRTEEDDE